MEQICANPDCNNPVPPSIGRGRARKWCSERCRKTQYHGTCEVCGARTTGTASGSKNGRAARFCKVHGQASAIAASAARSAEMRAKVEAMWAEGKSIKEIAAVMGASDYRGYISRMRGAGCNLPHRRKNGVAAMQIKGTVSLVKARAMRGQPYTLAQCTAMVKAWAAKYHRTPTAQDSFGDEALPSPYCQAVRDLGGWRSLMTYCELPAARSPSSGRKPEPADVTFAWREYGNLKDVGKALRLKPEEAVALLKRTAEGRLLLEGQNPHGYELAHARAEDTRAGQPVAPPRKQTRERAKQSPARAAKAAVNEERRRRTEAFVARKRAERAAEERDRLREHFRAELEAEPTDESEPTSDCTCVIGEADTEFDPACPYHGDNGTMVAHVRPSMEYVKAPEAAEAEEDTVQNSALERARNELRTAETELEAKVNELEEQLSPLRIELTAVRAAAKALERAA